MTDSTSKPPAPATESRSFLGVFRYSRRALDLVWSTSRSLTVALGLLTLLARVMPAAMEEMFRWDEALSMLSLGLVLLQQRALHICGSGQEENGNYTGTGLKPSHCPNACFKHLL